MASNDDDGSFVDEANSNMPSNTEKILPWSTLNIIKTDQNSYLCVNDDNELTAESLSNRPYMGKWCAIFERIVVFHKRQAKLCYRIIYSSPDGRELMLGVNSKKELKLKPISSKSDSLKKANLFTRERKTDGSGREMIKSFKYGGYRLTYNSDCNIVEISSPCCNSSGVYFNVCNCPGRISFDDEQVF